MSCPPGFLRASFLVGLGFAILAATPAARAEKRVALVVGNANYERADKLPNPLRDARAIRDALAALGFEVVYGEDLGKRSLESRIGDFAEAARDSDIAFVYFAGHGATFGDIPYVVPVDAQFASYEKVQYELVPAETFIGELRRAKGIRIAVLDACRDNGAERKLKRSGSRGGDATRGLGRIRTDAEGLVVAYATQHLMTAADGDPNGNSPFTAALLSHLSTPGLDIVDVFRETARSVIDRTSGKQRPELSISLFDRYALVPLPSGAQAAAPKPVPVMVPSTMPPTSVPPTSVPPAAAPRPVERAPIVPTPPNVVAAVPATDCDRLAADPADKDRPRDIEGVPLDKIDPERAIPACRAALAHYPGQRRLHYAMARSLEVAKRPEEAAQHFRAAADSGSVVAMTFLGLLRLGGIGIERDHAEAFRLFGRAAEAGNADGMALVATMYAGGLGVAKDLREALRLFRQAADGGSAFAWNKLGMMYFSGLGVPRDHAEAVRAFRRAADGGDGEAINNLGFMYQEGHGVARNDQEAVRLYRRAADAGTALAWNNLAFMYQEGRGVAQDLGEAVRLYRKGIEAGNAEAMTNLGLLYVAGKGVDKNDREAAVLLRRAADAGIATAKSSLGYLYRHGKGVAKDEREAVRLFREAAESGNAEAMYFLGSCYRDGSGVTASPSEARRWFQKSAELGFSLAEAALANL